MTGIVLFKNYYRGQKRIAQERSREQDRMSQRFQRGFRDIPIVSDFQRKFKEKQGVYIMMPAGIFVEASVTKFVAGFWKMSANFFPNNNFN